MGGEKGKVFDGPNLQLPDVRGYGLRMGLTWLRSLGFGGDSVQRNGCDSSSLRMVCVCEKKMRKEG